MNAPASLTSHHASARKIVLAVDGLLAQLDTGGGTSLALQTEISQHLNVLARELLALKEKVPMAPDRSLWQKRVMQLQEQCESQRAALGKFASRAAAKQREYEDREALLQRRNGGGEFAINIDAQAREKRNLSEVDAQLDALTDSASSSLASFTRSFH